MKIKLKLFHKHRAVQKELYSPWEGDPVWEYECRCGYQWQEPVNEIPLPRFQINTR